MLAERLRLTLPRSARSPSMARLSLAHRPAGAAQKLAPKRDVAVLRDRAARTGRGVAGARQDAERPERTSGIAESAPAATPHPVQQAPLFAFRETPQPVAKRQVRSEAFSALRMIASAVSPVSKASFAIFAASAGL